MFDKITQLELHTLFMIKFNSTMLFENSLVMASCSTIRKSKKGSGKTLVYQVVSNLFFVCSRKENTDLDVAALLHNQYSLLSTGFK